VEEREVKLLVDRRATVPEPAVLFAGIGDWSFERIEQDAVYFDTSDFALARAGASLRFRSDDGWTVKIPRPRAGDALVREEHGFAGGPGDPPPAATDLVRAWTRSRPVVEVARVHTERHRFLAADDAGAPVVELDDDTVTAESGDGTTTSFRELEIEARSDAGTEWLDELVRRLGSTGAVPGDEMPKVVRALGPRAQEPPDLVVPEPPGRAATVEQLVRFTIGSGVRRLLEHDPVVRASDDPEGVHQARVATRRLRSDLRTLAPVLDEHWSGSLRAELQWIGENLGRVRDADVLLAAIEAGTARLPDGDRAAAGDLVDRLRAQRVRDRDDLLSAMRSSRYARLLDALVDAATSPRVRRAVAGERARGQLAALIRRPWKRVRTAHDHLPEPPERPLDADLHEIRKRAKQARYAFEAVAPILGRRAAVAATRAATRLADVQTALGDHQDAVVAAAWLRAAATDTDRPEVAFAAGRLCGPFDDLRRDRRGQWPAAWKRARRAVRRAQARATA
jgi:CHAD domain-containing protein